MSFTNCCNHRFIGDNHSPIQPDGYCLHCGFHPEIQKLQHQLEIQTKRVENLKKVLDYAEECMSEHCQIDEDCDHCQVKQWRQAIDQELEKQLEEVR